MTAPTPNNCPKLRAQPVAKTRPRLPVSPEAKARIVAARGQPTNSMLTSFVTARSVASACALHTAMIRVYCAGEQGAPTRDSSDA